MKRFGVITPNVDSNTARVDDYHLDRTYWELVGGFKPVANKEVAE